MYYGRHCSWILQTTLPQDWLCSVRLDCVIDCICWVFSSLPRPARRNYDDGFEYTKQMMHTQRSRKSSRVFFWSSDVFAGSLCRSTCTTTALSYLSCLCLPVKLRLSPPRSRSLCLTLSLSGALTSAVPLSGFSRIPQYASQAAAGRAARIRRERRG